MAEDNAQCIKTRNFGSKIVISTAKKRVVTLLSKYFFDEIFLIYVVLMGREYKIFGKKSRVIAAVPIGWFFNLSKMKIVGFLISKIPKGWFI